MRKILTFLFAALMSVGMFALTPKGTDTWDEGTKTLTVNSNLEDLAYQWQTEIEHVIISSGVTSIGNNAFDGCTGLTSIEIPNSVTSIGNFAFYECSGLTSVTIGNSVESIGERTFAGCYHLTSITIPNSVTSIGDYAFYECSGLTSVTIGNSVISIGSNAFRSCTFLTSITIPSSVTSIGNRAFRDTGLTSVTNYAVTPQTINSNVFYNVDLSSCTLYVPAESVSAYSDASVWQDFGTKSAIPAPAVAVTGVTLNQNEAQMTVGGETLTLTATVNPEGATDKSVSWSTSDGNVATVDNGVVTAVAAGTATITVTTTDGAFTATCAVTVTAPEPAVPEIVNPVQIDGLYYNLDADNQTAEVIKYQSGNKYTGDIIIPESVEYYSVTYTVTSIGYEAFGECVSLTSITIPNSVESIGQSAFMFCLGLESITIPNSVESIGAGAFGACIGLTSIVVASGNTTYDSRDNCNAIIETSSNTLIQGCQNTIIPNSVTSIGLGAFYYCYGLTSIEIPNSVISIGESAFQGCSDLTSVTIGNSVISIGDYAFAECSGLTSITCHAVMPPTCGDEVFDVVDKSSIPLYVPSGSEGDYQAADQWEDFTNIQAIADPAPTDEQVPTNVDPENPSYYYSTFFHSTQNYKLTNDGTTAFIADLSGSDLILTEIAKGSEVIPANTAVIFRKAGSAEPVALTPTEENGVSVNPEDNDLEGVDAITAVTSIDGLTRDNCYVLSGQQSVGFYLINSDNLKAHKAYVKYVSTPGQNNAPKKMRFVFNTTTGVESAQPSVISGQKLIENGQLIIIKNGVRYNAQGQIVK